MFHKATKLVDGMFLHKNLRHAFDTLLIYMPILALQFVLAISHYGQTFLISSMQYEVYPEMFWSNLYAFEDFS